MSTGGSLPVTTNRVRARAAMAVLACVAVLLVGPGAPGATATATAGGDAAGAGSVSPDPNDWRGVVNLYRAQAGLGLLSENATWSVGGAQHARYVVENDEIGHVQDPTNPWHTPAGADAAANGNVAGWSNTAVTAQDAVALWIGGPFHAVAVLDPDLRSSGYGSYANAASSGVRAAAVMDVLRGVVHSSHKGYPRIWPGNGASIPGTTLAPEVPEPLTSCPGYTRPAGHPLYAFFATAPTSVSATLRNAATGQSLQRCVITGSTYTNSDLAMQGLGRAVLAERNAVVVIPRQPLAAGESYELVITANAKTVSSTFTSGPLAWGPFYDVAPDHLVVDAIVWAINNGITTGFADGTFRPAAPVTRHAMLLFLWRLAGEPAPVVGDPGFSDVDATSALAPAIAWGVEQGITTGFPDGTFRPSAAVTRQAAMLFLWRSAGEPAPLNPDPGFSDVAASSAAAPAIAWGVEEGITTGFLDGTFRPTAKVTRQAAVAFLFRFAT